MQSNPKIPITPITMGLPGHQDAMSLVILRVITTRSLRSLCYGRSTPNSDRSDRIVIGLKITMRIASGRAKHPTVIGVIADSPLEAFMYRVLLEIELTNEEYGTVGRETASMLNAGLDWRVSDTLRTLLREAIIKQAHIHQEVDTTERRLRCEERGIPSSEPQSNF